MISIKIVNQQETLDIDFSKIKEISRQIFRSEGVRKAKINVVIMTDEAIHVLNKRYLNHDEPTDVLTFPLSETNAAELCGDIVVSADTAKAISSENGSAANDELLLYILHGCLHLCGFHDHEPKKRREMRKREAHYLSLFEIKVKHSLDD